MLHPDLKWVSCVQLCSFTLPIALESCPACLHLQQELQLEAAAVGLASTVCASRLQPSIAGPETDRGLVLYCTVPQVTFTSASRQSVSSAA